MTREEAWRRAKGYLYDVLSGEEADEIIKTLEQEPCNTLEYLEMVYTGARACDDVAEQVRLARAIAAYKQDVHEDCTVLDKIRAEIERQEKWLLQAGYTAYNVDIAFDAIKAVIAESEDK